MPRLLALIALVLLTACGRPLTQSETAFARYLYGDTIDTSRARFGAGLLFSGARFTRPKRPRVTCQQRIYPDPPGDTITTSPSAMALFNRVRVREDLYRDDFLVGLPGRIDLASAMIFAHEMTHVWQWQNRATTGYHPLRAAQEHQASADPYLFDAATTNRFRNYGYEQQGAIVEEYVCCRVLAPEAPRTARLHALLSESFPVARLDRAFARDAVLPWAGAQIPGICD